MPVQHYRELIVWQKAIVLVEEVYRVTNGFPKTEIYALTNQIRRAAVSVPSNIAEGQGRNSTRDFLHFLSIAHGSLMEVETQITIAERLGYLDETHERHLLESTAEVSRMLSGLKTPLNKKLATNH
jgi:four helix bundle protein